MAGSSPDSHCLALELCIPAPNAQAERAQFLAMLEGNWGPFCMQTMCSDTELQPLPIHFFSKEMCHYTLSLGFIDMFAIQKMLDNYMPVWQWAP